MERKGNGGDTEYVFVQTVVVHSARQSGWLDRMMGRGRLQEVPRIGVTQPVPRLGGNEERITAGTASGSARPPAASRNVDLWINALALGTLGAFLLSLYLLR